MRNAIETLNWPIILLAAVAYFAIGAIWYTVLFGKYWARAHSMDMNNRKGMVPAMIIGFLLTVVICATIDLLMYKAGGKVWTDWFLRTYILTCGFIGGFVGMGLNYQKRPLGIWFVDIGYHLIAALAASFILARWGMSTGYAHGM